MNQNEIEPFGFDFVNCVAADETVSAAVWSLIVVRGTDSAPASHLLGPPRLVTPQGSTQQTATVQGVGGLLPGVLYKIRALVTTSQGNVRELYSHIYGEDLP